MNELFELPDALYEQIVKLSKDGDALADEGRYDDALLTYNEALELLPSPKIDWEAATWIYAAIGDAQYFKMEFEEALDNFLLAQNAPGGEDNPFIHLRLGQCYFELESMGEARKFLSLAYEKEGKAIFEGSDPAYLEYVLEGKERQN